MSKVSALCLPQRSARTACFCAGARCRGRRYGGRGCSTPAMAVLSYRCDRLQCESRSGSVCQAVVVRSVKVVRLEGVVEVQKEGSKTALSAEHGPHLLKSRWPILAGACFIEVLERIETNRFYSRNRSSTSSMFRVIVVYMSKQLRNGPNGYQMKSQLNRQNHGNHNSSANEHQHSPFSREHEPLWPLWPAVKLQLRDASLACAYRPTTCFALVRCASTQGRCLRRVGVSPQ